MSVLDLRSKTDFPGKEINTPICTPYNREHYTRVYRHPSLASSLPNLPLLPLTPLPCSSTAAIPFRLRRAPRQALATKRVGSGSDLWRRLAIFCCRCLPESHHFLLVQRSAGIEPCFFPLLKPHHMNTHRRSPDPKSQSRADYQGIYLGWISPASICMGTCSASLYVTSQVVFDMVDAHQTSRALHGIL